MKLVLTLGAVLFSLTLTGAPASALPIDRGVAVQTDIQDAAYGCRRGWAPNRAGHCRRVHRGHAFGDTRPAPMWRQNARERFGGCAYARTPSGMKYVCR